MPSPSVPVVKRKSQISNLVLLAMLLVTLCTSLFVFWGVSIFLHAGKSNDSTPCVFHKPGPYVDEQNQPRVPDAREQYCDQLEIEHAESRERTRFVPLLYLGIVAISFGSSIWWVYQWLKQRKAQVKITQSNLLFASFSILHGTLNIVALLMLLPQLTNSRQFSFELLFLTLWIAGWQGMALLSWNKKQYFDTLIFSAFALIFSIVICMFVALDFTTFTSYTLPSP